MVYVSKICISIEGVIEQVLHDSVVLMRITACRNTEHIKIVYTEEALPRYKVPTKLYYRNDGRDKYPHIAMFFGKKNHPRDVVEVYQHHVKPIK